MVSQASASQTSSSQASPTKHQLPPARKRKRKFSPEELEILAEELSQHHKLLFGTQNSTAAATWKQEKWAEVLARINAQGVTHRTVTDLKKRWHDLRRKTRTKLTQIHRESRQTGGIRSEATELTNVEEMAARTLVPELIQGIGELDYFDSDGDWASSADSPLEEEEEEGGLTRVIYALEEPVTPKMEVEPDALQTQVETSQTNSNVPPEIAWSINPRQGATPDPTHENSAFIRPGEEDTQRTHEEQLASLGLQVISVGSPSQTTAQGHFKSSPTHNSPTDTIPPENPPLTPYQLMMLETARANNAILRSTARERNRRLAALDNRLQSQERTMRSLVKALTGLTRRTLQHYTEMASLTRAVCQLVESTSALYSPASSSNNQQPPVSNTLSPQAAPPVSDSTTPRIRRGPRARGRGRVAKRR